eukprot:93422-Rhodomonas_salina.5
MPANPRIRSTHPGVTFGDTTAHLERLERRRRMGGRVGAAADTRGAEPVTDKAWRTCCKSMDAELSPPDPRHHTAQDCQSAIPTDVAGQRIRGLDMISTTEAISTSVHAGQTDIVLVVMPSAEGGGLAAVSARRSARPPVARDSAVLHPEIKHKNAHC